MAQSVDEEIIKNRWEYFHHCCFSLPYVLEASIKEQTPFFMVLPENYKNHTTTSFQSPLYEGARVALVWVSSYFRFQELGNLDVRVLLVPEKINDSVATIEQLFLQALEQKVEDDPSLSPEQNMKRRILKWVTNPSSSFTKDINVTSYEIAPLLEEKTMITQRAVSNTDAKRVLITGAAGFIGFHLIQELLKKGYRVIGFDNLSCSTSTRLTLLQQNENFEFHQLDASHPFDIMGPIDIIIHLASVPSPAYFYAMPIETLRSGLNGTKETLELARRKNARYFFASSAVVYGNPKINPQPESYPGSGGSIGKRSQYDESKRGAETLIKFYFEKYNVDVRIGRLFNTFGPGMHLSGGRVITNFMQAIVDQTPMTIYGDGSQTRSLSFISDTVDGIVKLIESDEISKFTAIDQRIFNLGNPEEYTINEIAMIANKISEKYLQKKVPIHYIGSPDKSDPKVQRPDISYINKVTNFTPQISFETGLEKTFLSYYKA